jgi:aminoglycoside/choline kinase family phosphotransferase
MDKASGAVDDLVKQYLGNNNSRIEKLPQSGSDRIYFRVFEGNNTLIATYSDNVKENDTFIQFASHFKALQLPVPAVLAVNTAQTAYLQQDLGHASLLHQLEYYGQNEIVFTQFKKSLQQLAFMQIKGHAGFNYNWCITAKEFGKQAIMSDLLYCKYYFLDTLKLPYDKQALLDDFENLSTYLTKTEYKYFMFRDFQSRNIIVNNDEVFFIDFQGGMKGALQYDVASLLWQAKAELSDEWKQNLLHYYIDTIDGLLDKPVNRPLFVQQYDGYVLIRLLQVLGAYGFRGLFERKAHFLSSIPLALKNLQSFLSQTPNRLPLPEFDKILAIISSDEMISRFTPVQANAQTPLVVTIKSFSYKKGIPADASSNGGGFVFDCRGILNPGRFDEYKKLSGKDKPVIDFLEQQTQMIPFLNSAFDMADISVEDYIKRGFSSLSINFGCTGGQHRSVYGGEQMARHLKNKYKVSIVLEHTNQQNWVK